MENNQRPLQARDTKEENNIHDSIKSEGEYKFVQERILTKRSRILRFFSKVFWSLLIPVCVCVAVCYIYFSMFMDDETSGQGETGTENGIIINNETESTDEETTTGSGDKSNTDNLDIEENLVKLEETIKKMIVVVSVVRDNEEETTVEAYDNGEETTVEAHDNEDGTTVGAHDNEDETMEEAREDEDETKLEEPTGMKDGTTGAKEDNIPNENQSGTSDDALDDNLNDMHEGKPVEKHTGVVVSMYGPVYVLVQYENIKDYKELYIHIGDSVMLDTTVYDIDYVTGLALLKIEKSKVTEEVREMLSVATFREANQVIEGTSIVYCGNVVGNGPMFMKGHISNSGNDVSCIDLNYNMLITDIMFEGAKDGFLFNSKGNLVGIVGLDANKLQLPSVVAGARATDLVYIINNMLNGKKDIYFGITGQEVSAKIEEIAGGSMPRGIYVSSVQIDSPAYNAGVMPGDIIYMIDRINEPDMDKFSSCIESKAKGDTVSIGVKRRIGSQYNMYTMSVTLDNRD